MTTYYALYDERLENSAVGITLFTEMPSRASEARWFGKKIAEVLEGNTVFSVAEVDGHAVGSCEVSRDGPNRETQHHGILGLLIRRDYRGRGVGSALLADVLRKCRGKFEAVYLSVFSNNEVAKRLYTRHGFVKVGVLPHHIQRGSLYLDEDLMYLEMASYLPSSGDAPSPGREIGSG